MQTRCNHWIRLSVLPALLLAAVSTAGTEPPAWHEHSSSYDLAREAVQRGEALPLHEVRRHLHLLAPGRIVATQYEFEFERWVYEFKIVDPRGQLRKVHIDARTGELVKVSDY